MHECGAMRCNGATEGEGAGGQASAWQEGRGNATTSQTMGTRGGRREAAATRGRGALVDGRHRRDERRRDNQPDEIDKRGRW